MVIKCPECNHYVNDTRDLCPHCGAILRSDKAQPESGHSDDVPLSLEKEEEKQISQESVCAHHEVSTNGNDGVYPNCEGYMADDDNPVPNIQEPYEKESSSQNKLILPIVIGLLILAIAGGGWWYCKSSPNPKSEEKEVVDTIGSADCAIEVISTVDDNDSNPYIGKTYKGSGNGGGLYTEMTITFLDGDKCRCVSDWYQAYPEGKTLNGTYEAKDDHILVHCTYKGIDYDFDFEVSEDGSNIGFDKSDYSEGGTIGLNLMGLKLVDYDQIQKKKEFIETFYKGLIKSDYDYSYIKKHVSPKVLQLLKDEYDYDCEDGDCLAVWLFTHEGSDPGYFVSCSLKEESENDYLVVVKNEWEEYTVLLTVVKDHETYKIDNIEKKKK